MYNGRDYIAQQLDSILKQTITDWDLVVSDDGSTDGCIDIVKNYMAKDSRIKLVFNDGKDAVHGFKANFANALDHADGEYIAFCDQDDVWTADHLEVLLEGIKDYDVCGANAELTDKDLKSLGTRMLSDTSYTLFDPKTIFSHLLYNNIFQGTAMLLRTDFVKKHLPVPSYMKYHDHWFALNASVEGRANYVNKSVLLYRQHGDNQTKNDNMNFFKYVHRSFFANDTVGHKNTDTILMLTELKERIADADKKRQVEDAIRYFTNMDTGHKRRNVFFYAANYSTIYLAKKDRMFFLRLIKRFIFGL